MKLITPEISWHQKEPIFSVDFCPETWKLASCGADFTIKVWQVKEKQDGDDSIGIEFLSNLDRHGKPVNVVRFSPNGKVLASAGDDGAIVLWKLNENKSNNMIDFSDDFGEDIVNKETWNVFKMLRGHVEDVYDLAWSPDSNQLITGSVDNSAIIWDANKGQSLKILTDHKHYVQGVCWDPRGFYIATHSSDRSCRLYGSTHHKCLHNIHRNTSSYMKDGQLTKSKFSKMFIDETMQSFFRRCTFSPDGSFLFLPAGLCEGEKKPKKTSYIFARGHYSRPVRQLPGTKKATVAIRCSPICYELMEDKEKNPELQENNDHFKIPYRMIYAVVSLDAVTLYDTQHSMPIGYCANMHYASLTDATWSSDGRLLVISSTDGYCSFIKFDEGELGTPITFDPIEYQDTQLKIRAAQRKEAKKKESEQRRKEKAEEKAAKKAEEKAAAAALLASSQATSSQNLDDKQPDGEKNPVLPTVDAKTPKSSKPVLDKNQPTIEKLFVTPVRKRKRTSEMSPTITPKNEGSTTKCPSTPQNTPASTTTSTSNKTQQPKVDSLLKSVKTTLQQTGDKKTPKRATVTTLLSFSNKANSSEKKPVAKPPTVKTPKRVTATTLLTFGKSDSAPSSEIIKDNQEILKSPVEVKSPLPEPSTVHASPQQPPTTPKSVRGTAHAQTPPRGSPNNNRPPKRVHVTTLQTFNTSSSSSDTTKKESSESSKSSESKPVETIVID
ncbi:chromatin assembly factor 1 subunit B-like [Clytia hemisphaerica]|uniref:CAF1B/HIR1 beta-propeller domain-containing protein n=1 Tax=Clytia hemisphaerica TaxID=252671 RepID=A0A7M5V3V1_9CNID